MSPQEFHLMEEMDADELRAELRRLVVFNEALYHRKHMAADALKLLYGKWQETELNETDWVPLSALLL